MALSSLAIADGYLDAKVGHTRHFPRHHALSYRLWYLCVDLAQLPELNKLRLFSRNRFNLFSLRDRDYGVDRAQTLQGWITQIKAEYGLDDGPVTLLTLPRLLGHAFNPVSFWFMQDAAGALRAVLAEVNNTFGERHCYLCRHEDGRPIEKTDWLQRGKVFHVSPFMQVRGLYHFRFDFRADRIGVWIDYSDNDRKLLSTFIAGPRSTLTDLKLLTAFARFPLMTLKVVAMIHWHALRLWLKGIRYNAKPQPPTEIISR